MCNDHLNVSDNHPIILIVGPTAGGKTRLSIDLANALPGGGECIGCDSMQVYRGMDIGTAKPTPAERAQAPHHLIDIADPAEAGSDGFSVDRWLALANETIADVRRRGKWPIVVGGTNLYVQALLVGLDPVPPPDDALRAELQALDATELRARLERIDPDAASRIHPNDRKRTIRAIEVFKSTGRRLGDLQTQWERPQTRNDITLIGLEYPPEVINPRINARVKQMIDEGLVDEVQALYNGGRLGPQAREALGYKQIIDHLEGRSTLAEAIEQVKIRTRRFAKQQRTWLRRFRPHQPSNWIDAANCDSQTIAHQVFTCIAGSPEQPAGE